MPIALGRSCADAIDVALGDGGQDDDVAIRRQILRAQRRADEHAGLHRGPPTQLEDARTGDVTVVVVRALESGDHHAYDRHADLRSGQVDRHDFPDADGAQAIQHPGEVLGAGARVVGRHIAKAPPRRALAHQRPRAAQLLRDRRGRELVRPQVVARAGDVGGAHLDRLGQRPQQRDRARGMSPGAGAGVGMLVAAIGDQAVERGNADIGGRVPHGDGELGAFELGQHEGAIVVVDRAQIDARARPALPCPDGSTTSSNPARPPPRCHG